MYSARVRECLRYLAVSAILAAVAGDGAADDPPSPDAEGRTGPTSAQDLIEARRALMAELSELMLPVDSLAAGAPADAAAIRSTAATIESLSLAVPDLFPPTTNLYDAAAEQPVTLSLPSIWEDFGAFDTLAAATSSAAAALAAAPDGGLTARGAALRATCDACHAQFVRQYVPSAVGSSDLEFDFDAALGIEAPLETATPRKAAPAQD
jgi:cytochrome c556